MKKIALLFLILLLCVLPACGQDVIEPDNTTALITAETPPIITHPSLPVSTVKSVTPFSNYHNNWEPEGWHRNIYYEDYAYITDLVDYDEYLVWRSESSGKHNDFNEMTVVQFIKHFNITREQFDKANEKIMRESSLEPYNADIIYTFDPIAISNYYRQYDDEGNEIDWRELEPWNELLKP